MNANTLLPAALRRPEKSDSPRLLLSRTEAAHALNISERMLDQLTEPHGPLKAVRVGRRVLFSPAVLQRWIDSATCAEVASPTEVATSEQLS